MFDQDEPFCNPIAPANITDSAKKTKDEKHNLSNDDFRKLMMTPRTGLANDAILGSKIPGTVRGARKPILAKTEFKTPSDLSNDKKKAKKKFYQPIKNEEDDALAELAKKYRDRAKERRDNANPDYQVDDPQSILAYNAVAPDIKNNEDAAERRKQLIEESKYLGGDMKHTHLVKGLDYALLQKIRAEIEITEEEELEKLANEADIKAEIENEKLKAENYEIKSFLAKNIMKTLFKLNLPEKNDLFLPGRMAYVFELDDECKEDIPTAIIRSKADCPNWDAVTTLSTNDIVINKLISIFTEIRQGGKRKKKDKLPAEEVTSLKNLLKSNREKIDVKKNKNDISIYEDIEEYEPPDKRIRESDSRISRSSERQNHDRNDRYTSNRNYRDSYDKNDQSESRRRESSRSRDRDYQNRRRNRDEYRSKDHYDYHKRYDKRSRSSRR